MVKMCHNYQNLECSSLIRCELWKMYEINGGCTLSLIIHGRKGSKLSSAIPVMDVIEYTSLNCYLLCVC